MPGFCSWNFGPSVMGSVHSKVFSVLGPNNYQINSLGILKSEKNTQRNLTQRFFSPPPRPPSKFFVFAFFLHFKEKTQPEHKEFPGLKAPKKGGFRHGILGEIFVFGCLFRP